jgi:hypothetical protein
MENGEISPGIFWVTATNFPPFYLSGDSLSIEMPIFTGEPNISSCLILGIFVEFRPDTGCPVTALRSVPGFQ